MEHTPTKEQQTGAELTRPTPVPQINDPAFLNRDPNDEAASFGGVGTLEILEVTKLLNGAGITCCMVGVSALIYYGAGRVRHEWEVCVPTERHSEASAFLASVDTYETYPPRPPDLRSLLHTFPRFKLTGKAMCFTVIPSDDAHIDCTTSNIEHSKMGLPYPTLEIFAQSLLDTDDMVALADLVDGMDLTEQWGSDFLKLDAENDVAWAQRKNEKIRASVPTDDPYACLLELPTTAINLKETWNDIVGSKERRMGPEYPEGVFNTRFRPVGSDDPRSRDRYNA